MHTGNRTPGLMLTAALTVTGAVAANVVAALTVRVCAPVVPSTVLPEAVRVLLVLVRFTPLVKLARPVLSMVRRSASWPVVLALLLPTVVVLSIKLPPQLPAESCKVKRAFLSCCYTHEGISHCIVMELR